MPMISPVQNGFTPVKRYPLNAKIEMQNGSPVAVLCETDEEIEDVCAAVFEETMHEVYVVDTLSNDEGVRYVLKVTATPRVVGHVEVYGEREPTPVYAIGEGADTEYLCLHTTEEEARQERRYDQQAEAIFSAMVEAGYWSR